MQHTKTTLTTSPNPPQFPPPPQPIHKVHKPICRFGFLAWKCPQYTICQQTRPHYGWKLTVHLKANGTEWRWRTSISKKCTFLFARFSIKNKRIHLSTRFIRFFEKKMKKYRVEIFLALFLPFSILLIFLNYENIFPIQCKSFNLDFPNESYVNLSNYLSGIAAPFLSLITIYLVYKTYQQGAKSYSATLDKSKIDMLNPQLSQIRNLINTAETKSRFDDLEKAYNHTDDYMSLKIGELSKSLSAKIYLNWYENYLESENCKELINMFYSIESILLIIDHIEDDNTRKFLVSILKSTVTADALKFYQLFLYFNYPNIAEGNIATKLNLIEIDDFVLSYNTQRFKTGH